MRMSTTFYRCCWQTSCLGDEKEQQDQEDNMSIEVLSKYRWVLIEIIVNISMGVDWGYY